MQNPEDPKIVRMTHAKRGRRDSHPRPQTPPVRPLTILHTEASLGWGGQEIRIVLEAESLSRLGHRLLIVAPPESRIFSEASARGITAIPLAMTRRTFPVALMRLIRLIEQHRVDIVNTHSSLDSWIASLAARLSTRRPRIIRTRHIHTAVRGGKIIYGTLPDQIITTSEAIRQLLIARCGVRPDQIATIPTGVDLDQFHPAVPETFRQEMGIGRETVLIGMVSVLRSWKGHQYFLAAVDRLRKQAARMAFVIVGDGPIRGQIEQWRADLHLEATVTLTGHRNDVPQILAALDVLVLPSYAHEGIPQILLQAQAMATAVVASDIDGIREVVIDGETGLLSPPRDSQALAGRIERLIGDAALRERLGQQSRARVLAQWTLPQMTDRILALYR